MSMYGFWADFFTVLQVLIGVFLIFIIMLQRGKGGGLVGALGGMGGASAFGPKADVQVLKLTIGLAVAWVFLACVGIFFNRWYAPATYGPTGKPPVAAAPETKGVPAKDKTDPSAKTEPGTSGPELKNDDKKVPKKGAAVDKPAAEKSEAEKPAVKKPVESAPAAENKAAPPAKAEAPAEKTDTEKK